MQSTHSSSGVAGKATPENETQSYSRLRTILISALAAPGAALLASLAAVVLMGLFRLLAGIATPVELFGDYVLKHINVNTFIQLLIRFSPNSKTAPLGLALLGMIAAGIALGWLYAVIVGIRLPARSYRPDRREWLTALSIGIAMTLVGVLLFRDELWQNFYGLPLGWASFTTGLALLADFLLYAVVLCLAYRAILPKRPVAGVSPVAQNRRLLFSRAGVALLSAGGAAASYGLVRKFLDNYTSYDGMNAPTRHDVTPLITPNADHYVVTQNPVDPNVNIGLWRLEVTGLVKNSGSYTFTEVQQLPSTSRAITLECIANGVSNGSHLISTAIWQGVSLRTLLDKHGGAQSNATHVAFYSVDGYSISLPLKEVLEADALLAWRMNGAELPHRHGYPMRVLIPGRYGEENSKWLTRVELTDHFVGGLYANQGWYNGPLHTMSRIDHPKGRVFVGQPVEIGGIAYGGDRGIQKVEISTDDGVSWNVADLEPALSPDAWVAWRWQWTPRSAGKYTLLSRATDSTGQVQTDKVQGTVPNGSTGYCKVTVDAM